MKKLLLSSIVAAGIVASSASFAAAAPCMTTGIANPWYVGVGINYPAVTEDNLRFSSAQLKQRNEEIGGNVFAGYHINRYFGTELGFSYLGEQEYRVAGSSVSTPVKLENESQWNIHYVGNVYLPVTSWFMPYVFGGVAYMSNDFKVKGSAVKHDFAGFGLTYGAGLQFNINQFGIRVNYTRLDAPSNIDTAVTNGFLTNKDFISLDVLYRFSA